MPKKDAIQPTKSKGTATKAKGKPKTRRVTGRPKTIIDWNKVDAYLKAGCTGTGIAGMLGIHEDTLYLACQRDHKMTFSAYSQQKKAEGDDLLRFVQFNMAMKGDKTMAIWLGKQRLGQREKPTDPDADANDMKNITFNITEELIEDKNDGQETGEGSN